MANKATPHICSSEREFLGLKGDGTEAVKVTADWDMPDNFLNGWYVFLKTGAEENSFVKQSTTCLPLIDRLSCETKYFQFDETAGLLPDSFHYNYRPVGVGDVEYEGLKAKLEAAGAWRPIRQVTKWEFVEGAAR